jgi:hypothetical protein
VQTLNCRDSNEWDGPWCSRQWNGRHLDATETHLGLCARYFCSFWTKRNYVDRFSKAPLTSTITKILQIGAELFREDRWADTGEWGVFRIFAKASKRRTDFMPSAFEHTGRLPVSHSGFQNIECYRSLPYLLWAGRPRGRNSNPSTAKNFLNSVWRPTESPIHCSPGSLSPGLRRPGYEADHSPPTSAEVKKTFISTSTPTYAFMA